MIDWLAIVIALVIITALVGGFGFLAWKINMSDPLARDDIHQPTELGHEKRRKEKNSTDQSKKKRKDQKKSKRENKDDQERRPQDNKPSQTSEETDDEREESEQEILTTPVETIETSSKARKRHKNKPRTATPPPSSKTPSETNTKNKLPSTRVAPATYPKSTSNDELESTKQQSPLQTSHKQTLPTPASTATTKATKKPTQIVQNQEQPFQVVGGNRHKTATPSVQQQNKPQANFTSPVVPMQQSSTTPVQQEQLPQRQPLSPTETSGSVNVKQTSTVVAQPKISDLIKVLPSSQAVVTELMSALDAFSLSSDELGIIMHKIANKQSVLNQDWSRLQQGQKVDPQAQIGQVLDQSARAFEDDGKSNSMKALKDLTNQLNAEKHRNNDLLKDKNDKEREIQILHAQLDSVQHRTEPSTVSPPVQALEFQLKRITEENRLLTHQLAQQQQQLATSNLSNASIMQVQVLTEEIKKLSVINGNLEKKVHGHDLLVQEAQKERENLLRYKEQLTQSLQNTEEKYQRQLNETRTTHSNEINEYQIRMQQLERDNEQLKREEIVHVEPSTATDIQTITINNEEREQLENEIEQLKQRIASNEQTERELNDLKRKFSEETEEYQKKIEQFQSQHQLQANEFKEEMERLKQEKNDQQQQVDESRTNELNTLRAELDEVKSTLSQSEERLHAERDKHRQLFVDLLPQDLRNQLPNDNQDFDQWFSSYRQLSESNKRNVQEEIEALQRENAKIHQNMTEIENQLKDIETTVQSKEEVLLTELQSKHALVETLRDEKEQISHELQRLRHEILNLQSIHDASTSETENPTVTSSSNEQS